MHVHLKVKVTCHLFLP